MIDNNKIYFGYGSVLVNSSLGILSLTSIKPPQPIGPVPKEIKLTYGERIEINDIKLLLRLEKALKTVNTEKGSTIGIDKYTIIFAANSDGSLKIIQKAIDQSIIFQMIGMAC